VVGARDGTGALLDDVSEFVDEDLLVRAVITDDHVVAGGVRPRAKLSGGGAGGTVGVDPDRGEVRPKEILHLLPPRRG
jgi:hypothetical protein